MDGMVINEALQSMPLWERSAFAESIFSLDCLKNGLVREAILEFEENEAEEEVDAYTNERVYSRYIEIREQIGEPLNLAEYLAERREWEYDSQDGCEEPDSRKEFDRARSNHALELLAEYERRTAR